MENTRTSGSYTSRAANPPAQPSSDSYSQKRSSSYRRPIDPQPAPTHAPSLAASNGTPSNSARPVAAAVPPNGVSRSSSHRRRQSQQLPPTAAIAKESLLAAPDAPRGPPPTSYRDPYAPKGSSRSHGVARTYSGRSRDPTIHTNASRQQPNIQIAPNRLQELRAVPLSGTVEVQGRSTWVPDRSPLQKLEGKLDDISKEEKRARMLELELAAQEKAEAESRARRVREAAAKHQRIVSGPAPSSKVPTGAPVRTASTRRNVSMPVHTKPMSPEIAESDDGVMYDLSEPWDPSRGAGPKTPQPPPELQLPSSVTVRHKSRLSHVEDYVGRKNSVKGKEPAGVSLASGSFRDRTEQNTQRIERKPVVAPTGLGLYGVEGASEASVSRHDSKRLSKDLPPTPRELIPGNDRRKDSRGIQAAQMEMEQARLDQKSGTGPLNQVRSYDTAASTGTASNKRHSVGFAASVPEAEPDFKPLQEPQDMHHHFNVFSNHEPDRRYVAPPMLEEWRNAPVVVLGGDDLDLDVPTRLDSTKPWWEENSSTNRRRSSGPAPSSYDGYVDEPSGQTTFNPPLYLKCGPLLRYTGLRKDKSRPGKEREIWRGSVMIVTIDGQSSYQKPPTLRLFKQPMDLLPPPPNEIDTEGQPLNPDYVDPIEGQVKVSRSGKTLYVKPIDEIPENEDLSRLEDDDGLFQEMRAPSNANAPHQASRVRKDGERLGKYREIPAVRLHAERGVTFWRFNLEIELGSAQARIAYRINRGPAVGFWVPAKGETMNMMFHSCNGFSLSVDSKQFCGPDPMWRDVLNNHQTRPFHVMIGGGDQIYNDAAMRQTTLFKQWTESRNALQKHRTSFSLELQNELEQFYLDRYSMWFSQGLFGMANSQIPMVNIWDDHDIIDGYGSYPHHFMSTPVFTGLGAVAFKYYMLFQHQSVAAETGQTEPSWLLGAHPGPYIREQSRSVFMFLGRKVAFLGLDCRTERQRNEILTEDSYDVVFDRLEEEIVKGETKHLIVLLGVPIAYPRLNFLENILTSRLMDPIKALGRTGALGNFVNKFDGGVEILDDLDDHWTAKHHKEERNWLIRELQHIASTKSVRVTILGGDVHLAAVGQFYTQKKLNIPKDKDHRYMPNVISSAIVNTPPPEMMADILNKRNKVHHLDPYTDEDMIPLFTHDTDGKKRNNTHLLPRRNWCSLREYKPGSTPPATPPTSLGEDGPRITRTFSDYTPGQMVRRMSNRGRTRESRPPVAYHNNPAYAAADYEQAGVQSSFSPERDEQPRKRRNSLTSLFRRRASVDSVNPPGSVHSMPTPRNRDSISAQRPSPFHRRPSVLNNKGHKSEGDYINLEGGLDICLNLEQSQKDPAGITTPYRLLVPALDYIATEPSTVPKERRKPRLSSMFSFGGNSKHRTIGDDGYSHAGSDVDSQSDDIGEVDEEERARQRYKVGPRILIPGFSKKRNSVSANHADEPRAADPPIRSDDYTVRHSAGTGQFDEAKRFSAPTTSYNTTPVHSAPTQPIQHQISLTRSGSNRQPTYNSSHKSQLPEPEPKVYQKSMGGILNQHRGAQFEHDAHIVAHTSRQQKRESYPPHPAIVGAGPGSPYSRRGVEPRPESGGEYFASGGRNGVGSAGGRNGLAAAANAGVGARYLGNGRYAGDNDYDDEEDEYSDEDRASQDSFVPPKPKSKWKIWK